jgi:ParB/RepB/Spo0J family partition protein
MAKAKSKKKKKDEGPILFCESTGKKVRLTANFDMSTLLLPETRVLAPDTSATHLEREKREGVRMVSVKAIHCDPESNMRKVDVGSAEFKELIASISDKGLLSPVVVCRSTDKLPCSYNLLAGFRRFTAMCELNMPLIPVRVLPPNVDRFSIQLTENCVRKDAAPYDVATALVDLQEHGKPGNDGERVSLSNREVAKMLGWVPSKVSNYVSLAINSSDVLREAVEAGELPVSKAAVLSTVVQDRQEELMPKVMELDYNDARRFVFDWRKQHEDMPDSSPGAPRSPESPYKMRKASILAEEMVVLLRDYRDDPITNESWNELRESISEEQGAQLTALLNRLVSAERLRVLQYSFGEIATISSTIRKTVSQEKFIKEKEKKDKAPKKPAKKPAKVVAKRRKKAARAKAAKAKAAKAGAVPPIKRKATSKGNGKPKTKKTPAKKPSAKSGQTTLKLS